MHRDEIVRRVTTLWGLKRAGRRIVDAVEMALYAACDSGEIVEEAPFFSRPGRDGVPVRNRENVASSGLRRPEMLPPSEISSAIKALAAAHFGVARDELAVKVARLFGYRSTSSQLRDVICREIDALCGTAVLESRNGKLYAAGDEGLSQVGHGDPADAR